MWVNTYIFKGYKKLRQFFCNKKIIRESTKLLLCIILVFDLLEDVIYVNIGHVDACKSLEFNIIFNFIILLIPVLVLFINDFIIT